MDNEIRNEENLVRTRGTKGLGEVLGALSLALICYHLAFTMLVFISPILIYSIRHGKKKGSLLLLAELLLIIALELVRGKPGLDTVSLISFAMNMYIPMSLSAAGIVWLHSNRVKLEKRIFLSLLPSLLLALCIAIPFCLDRALFNTVYSGFENVFVSIVEPALTTLNIKIDLTLIFEIFILTVMCMVLPVVMVAVCASCFIYETAKHSKESGWEDRVRGIEFNTDLIWLFLGSWVLVLLNYFISIPVWIEVIVLNFAFAFAVLYSIQGFSVLYSRLSRRSVGMKSMSLFMILLVLVMSLPGLGIFIMLGLPLLGVLECFFDMKKNGVKKNENYS